jgi:hypothetical protein
MSLRSTKSSWLNGDGDLQTREVEDVPVKGESVLVRGLPAAYSNQASSEALEMKQTPRGDSIATVNTARLEVLQFLHGVIDPKFDLSEVEKIAENYGPAFKKVIAAIDDLSGVDKEALENATARFRSVDESPSAEALPGNGTAPASLGDGGSDVPTRTGGETGDAG